MSIPNSISQNKDSESGSKSKQKSAGRELPAGYERGVLKKFFESHGFILPDNGGPDVFVHVNDIGPGVNTLKPKPRVIFKRGPGIKPYSIQAFDVRGDQERDDESKQTGAGLSQGT